MPGPPVRPSRERGDRGALTEKEASKAEAFSFTLRTDPHVFPFVKPSIPAVLCLSHRSKASLVRYGIHEIQYGLRSAHDLCSVRREAGHPKGDRSPLPATAYHNPFSSYVYNLYGIVRSSLTPTSLTIHFRI